MNYWASPVAQLVKNLPAMRKTWFNPWVGKIPWRRDRLPTPVSWPGEFHGLYSPWGRKESDTTEQLNHHPSALDTTEQLNHHPSALDTTEQLNHHPSASSVVFVFSDFLFFFLFICFLLFMLKMFLKCLILGSVEALKSWSKAFCLREACYLEGFAVRWWGLAVRWWGLAVRWWSGK